MNRRIENNKYQRVKHGFLSIISQLLCKELIVAQLVSDRYMFTASRKQNYSGKS